MKLYKILKDISIVLIVIFINIFCLASTSPNKIDIFETKKSKTKLGFTILPSENEENKIFKNIFFEKDYSNIINNSVKNFIYFKENNDLNIYYVKSLSEIEEIDFSQEFYSIDKKNLVLFTFETEKAEAAVYNILGLITFGIIPIKNNLNFNLTPIVFDSNGKRYVLNKLKFSHLNEWRGIISIPIKLLDNNLESYFTNALSSSMNYTINEINRQNINISDFNTDELKFKSPIRNTRTSFNCQKSFFIKNNKFITAPLGKKICSVDLNLLNFSNSDLKINSQYFYYVSEDGIVPSLNSKKENNVDTMEITKEINISPFSGDLKSNSINIKFLVKENREAPRLIHFYDSNISDRVITLKINSGN